MTKFLTWDPVTKVLSQAEETVQVPAGTIHATISATADPGYELIDGTTVVGAQTLYPDLWAKLPASWKSGADMVKPDWREMTLGGFKSGSSTHGTLGGSTGANTKTIAQGNLPAHVHTLAAHTHTINHDHASVTSGNQSADHTHSGNTGTVSADHTHSFTTGGQSQGHLHSSPVGTGEILARDGVYGTGYNGPHISVVGGGVAITWSSTTTSADRDHTHSGTTGGISANHFHGFTTGGVSVNHTHTVDLPNFTGTSGGPSVADTGSVGSGTPLDVINAAGVVNWQIKAH